MIMDEYNEFCDATALSIVGTGKALVGDVIDLGAAGEDPGNGRQVFLNIEVTTAVTSAGAATVSFILASDDAAAIAVDDSATEHVVTAAIPKASLVAGYRLAIPLPVGVGQTYEQYLGILQDVGTAALTAGAINAFLSLDTPVHTVHPDGTN